MSDRGKSFFDNEFNPRRRRSSPRRGLRTKLCRVCNIVLSEELHALHQDLHVKSWTYSVPNQHLRVQDPIDVVRNQRFHAAQGMYINQAIYANPLPNGNVVEAVRGFFQEVNRGGVILDGPNVEVRRDDPTLPLSDLQERRVSEMGSSTSQANNQSDNNPTAFGNNNSGENGEELNEELDLTLRLGFK